MRFLFKFDFNEKSRQLIEKLRSEYGEYEALDSEEFDVIIVLGGDGFMLKCLHKYMHFKKPFFGINTGNAGFLLNLYKDIDLVKRIAESKSTKICPLKMIAKMTNGEIKIALAFNEISISRGSPQAAKMKIFINGTVRIEELIADGILLATPAGSSAYNFSVGGSVVPIESNILSLTPIGAFRPKRWGGALLPHNTKVRCEIIEHEKRPVNAVTDFNQHGDILAIDMEESDLYVELLFDLDHSLEERIMREQFLY